MKHLLIVILFGTAAFLGLGTTAFSQVGESQKLVAKKQFAIKISLGIVDDKHYDDKERIAYPLLFRVENSGKYLIKADDIPEIYFAGFVHTLSAGGKEQQTEVQPYWRTMVQNLPPGKTFDSPDYANLLDFFPGLKDGEYQVRWTRGKLKSNVLRFIVTKGKLSLHQPQT